MTASSDDNKPLFIVLQTGDGEELDKVQVWPMSDAGMRQAFDFQDHVTGLVRRMQAARLKEYLGRPDEPGGNRGVIS